MANSAETPDFPHKSDCNGRVESTGMLKQQGEVHYVGFECLECGRYAEQMLASGSWIRNTDDD